MIESQVSQQRDRQLKKESDRYAETQADQQRGRQVKTKTGRYRKSV